MWDLFKRFKVGTRQSVRALHQLEPTLAKVNPGRFWGEVNGPQLAQGDWLRDCLIPIFPRDIRVGQEEEVRTADLGQADLIIVTQSCDLENQKARFVALCPIYALDEFSRMNPKFAKKPERDEVRKGRYEGLHMLASPTLPENNLNALIVDFRQIFSLPIDYLSEHAVASSDRWRLQSPYLEHFSQALARFFMRVGLPSSIPPFK